MNTSACRAHVPASIVARPQAARVFQKPAVTALKRNIVIVRADPAPDAVETAIKGAEEACKDGATGECAAAWDEVEEISAAIAHKKAAKAAESTDPLDKLCEEEPDAAECRVYED